jgi:hypothetical protein
MLKPAFPVRLYFGVDLSNGAGDHGCLLQHLGKLGSSIRETYDGTGTDCLACGEFHSRRRGFDDLCWFVKSPPLLIFSNGRFKPSSLESPIGISMKKKCLVQKTSNQRLSIIVEELSACTVDLLKLPLATSYLQRNSSSRGGFK